MVAWPCRDTAAAAAGSACSVPGPGKLLAGQVMPTTRTRAAADSQAAGCGAQDEQRHRAPPLGGCSRAGRAAERGAADIQINQRRKF